jgi:hypothetical protein
VPGLGLPTQSYEESLTGRSLRITNVSVLLPTMRHHQPARERPSSARRRMDGIGIGLVGGDAHPRLRWVTAL